MESVYFWDIVRITKDTDALIQKPGKSILISRHVTFDETGPKHLIPCILFLPRTDLNKLQVESTAQQLQRLEPHPNQSTLQPISSLPTTQLRVQTTLQPVCQTTPQMLPMQP